jgi:hypothetical protein
MLKIKAVCAECREKLRIELSYGNGPELITLEVEPHACMKEDQDWERAEITMFYNDLSEHLRNTKVLMSYFKKNGDFRSLVGFLGVPHESKPELVYFVEKELDDDEAQVKLLLKKNIASVTDMQTQQRYKVIGGLTS